MTRSRTARYVAVSVSCSAEQENVVRLIEMAEGRSAIMPTILGALPPGPVSRAEMLEGIAAAAAQAAVDVRSGRL